MRVWFFGSRNLARLTGPGALAARNTTLLRINQAVRKLGEGAVVVTGACPTGPDAWAERAATRRGLRVERHPADWNTHGRSAGPKRNEEIAASRPDFAVGAWDLASRGTRHSIKMCRAYGIPFVVYGPSGAVVESSPGRAGDAPEPDPEPAPVVPQAAAVPANVLAHEAAVAAYVRDNLATGVVCPCCQQQARLYKRPLNAQMARGLIWLCRTAGDARGWVDVAARAPNWLLRSREFAKLHHWGLIEERAKDPDDTIRRTSGIWRPTVRGVQFVQQRIRVPRRVYLYNNEVQGWDAAYVGIADALGAKFNYADLMAGRA